MFVEESSPSDNKSLLDRAIAEFLTAVSPGKAGARQLWLDRFPDCAAGLAEFFDDLDELDNVAAPLRLNSPTSPIALTSPHPASSQRSDDTVDSTPEPPQFTTVRYRPLRFHARGGMGEIWLSTDERIGRPVALKKLRKGRDQDHSRFFIEAQITGQLEHPSIVPLHDLGFDDSGQPFYVMKFIRGRRFREAIADFHSQNIAENWSEDISFRRLIEILVCVCNVVAYAHSKGVLHRDIKPDNIMLGPYGETLVVDWGLAKVIGRAEEERGSGVRLSDTGSTATQDGAIVGSPFYMSPEGAEGHPDAVDEASDVYLLGATLYEILTACPPRRGSSSVELIDSARRIPPASPRKINPRIPRPLEAICLKAMAFRKEDRYSSPLKFADDLARFLAGATVSAYREPFLLRARRWLRRHRRGIARAAALLTITTLAGLAISNFRSAKILSEREHARQNVSDLYRLADEAQYFAANSDSIGERVPYYDPRRAEQAAKAALAIAAPWGDRAAALPIAEEREAVANTEYSLLMLLAQSRLSASHQDSDLRAALGYLEQARSIQTPTRGFYELSSRIAERLGDRDAADRDQRRSQSPGTPVTAQDHFLRGEHLRLRDVESTAAALGSAPPPKRPHLESAIDEYRSAVQLDPHHYWAQYQNGRCLLAIGNANEAVEAFTGCIAIRPSSPWAYTSRGLAQAMIGHTKSALEDLNRAVKLKSDFTPALLNRGFVSFWLLHDVDAALEDFNRVLAGPSDKQLIEARFYRGQVLSSAGKMDDAIADFNAVINSRPDFAPAYWMRAKTHFLIGKVPDGLADTKQYVRLTASAADDAATGSQRFSTGKTLRLLGQQLQNEPRKQVLECSVKELQAAIDAGLQTGEAWQTFGAVQELLGHDAEAVTAYTRGLADVPNDLRLRRMRGWVYANRGEYDLAQIDFTEAIRIASRDAEAHAGLGFVRAEQGRMEEAQREATTALLADPDNHLGLHWVACIFGRLSAADPTKQIEQEDLAIAALTRAIALSHRNPLGQDGDEVTLIKSEKSFPESLRKRPEFSRLEKTDLEPRE